jgi:hypothetical protein
MTATGKLVHPQTMGRSPKEKAHTVSTDRLNKFVTKKFHWKALTPSDQLAMAEEILEWRAMSDGR